MQTRKALLLVIGAPLLAMLATLGLISAVNGPTEDGVRCERPGGGVTGQCQVLRSRFLGYFGNDAYPVEESAIRGAVSECPYHGRAGTSCFVWLTLTSGEKYLVLSFSWPPQADTAARRINAYLGDPSRTQFELRESILTPVLVFAGALLVGVVLVLLARRVRRDRAVG